MVATARTAPKEVSNDGFVFERIINLAGLVNDVSIDFHFYSNLEDAVAGNLALTQPEGSTIVSSGLTTNDPDGTNNLIFRNLSLPSASFKSSGLFLDISWNDTFKTFISGKVFVISFSSINVPAINGDSYRIKVASGLTEEEASKDTNTRIRNVSTDMQALIDRGEDLGNFSIF